MVGKTRPYKSRNINGLPRKTDHTKTERPRREPVLPKIHERGERLRVEARSAHERAIQFFLRHQPPNIVRLDAAAIENPEGRGVADGELFPPASPETPMSLGGKFLGRRAAPADGPNRLARDQNSGST